MAAMGYCLPAFFNAAIGGADNLASSQGTGMTWRKPSSFSKKPPKYHLRSNSPEQIARTPCSCCFLTISATALLCSSQSCSWVIRPASACSCAAASDAGRISDPIWSAWKGSLAGLMVDGKGQEDVNWRIKRRGRTKSGQWWLTGGNREPCIS